MIIGPGISPPEIILQKDAATPPALKGLKAGQVIRAKVLGVLSENRAQLLMAGQKVTAETGLSLTPGQEIQLRMIREKGQLTFKLIDGSPQSRTGSRQEVSLARLARALVSFEKLGQDPGPVLGSILEELALKSGKTDEGFLPRLMKNSGLLLEKKIAALVVSGEGEKSESGIGQLTARDLKAAVLRMLAGEGASAGRAGSGKAPSLNLVRSLASALEQFQTLNTQAAESHRFILPFPVMAGEQFRFGQLFMDLGRKAGGGETGAEDQVIRLAFLLEMSSLGSLRADFSILKTSLTGRFLLEDQETCDYLTTLMPGLGRRLAAMGYQMGRVECRVAEPRQLAAGALIHSIVSQRQVQGLDLVI